MTAIRNFEQQSNGRICSCGDHHGVGIVGPGDRAARYARMRDNLPGYFTAPMKGYLASFEAMHGRVLYMMEQTGVGTGEYVPKNQPVYAPVCTSYLDAPLMLANSKKIKQHDVGDWS